MIILLIGCGGLSAHAGAQGSSSVPPPAPVPYSIPWQLRPATVGTGIRLDSSLGFWRDSTRRDGATRVIGIVGSRKVSERVALVGRLSIVDNGPPSSGPEKSARVISNPLIGATFLRNRPGGRRGALFVAATLPLGTGGGDSPRPEQTAALSRAIATRSAMDNALFAVNYFTLIGGLSVARVIPGATVQAEATVLQLFRVRGPTAQDQYRTNFTAGVHLGRSFRPRISAGLDLRYQRWLSDAAPVRASREARETWTLAFGPRLHFKFSGSKWIRPGLSLTLPLDRPLSGQRYRMLQIDVPVSF